MSYMAVASIPVKGGNASGLWRVFQWIIERHHEGFYGTISLKMQAGRVVMVHADQAQKPEDLLVKDLAAGDKHLAGLPY
jgi:hypothetical protein